MKSQRQAFFKEQNEKKTFFIRALILNAVNIFGTLIELSGYDDFHLGISDFS